MKTVTMPIQIKPLSIEILRQNHSSSNRELVPGKESDDLLKLQLHWPQKKTFCVLCVCKVYLYIYKLKKHAHV